MMPNGYRRIFLLVACGLLLTAVGAPAQVNHPYNEVGIFTVENPDGCAAAQIDVPVMTPFTCYVVLTAPWNEDLGHAVTTVGGMEFHIEVPAEAYLLSMTLPYPSTWWPEGRDVLVGVEAPVVGNRCTLMTLSLMTTTEAPVFVSLLPVQNAPQNIPGEMAFTDFDDAFSLHVMHPISGSADVPVFAINWTGDLSFCETVPDAGMSFGGVKALYR